MLRTDVELDLPTVAIAQNAHMVRNTFLCVQSGSLVHSLKCEIGGARPHSACRVGPVEYIRANVVNHTRLNATALHMLEVLYMRLRKEMLKCAESPKMCQLHLIRRLFSCNYRLGLCHAAANKVDKCSIHPFPPAGCMRLYSG